MKSPLKYPKYFFQSQVWIDFVESALDQNHQTIQFEENISETKFNLSTVIYNYPWYFRQKMWYIPRFPGFDKDLQQFYNNLLDLNTAESQNILNFQLKIHTTFANLLQKIITEAKKNQVTFVKIDFDDQICKILNIGDNEKLLQFLKNIGIKNQYLISQKIVQFTATMTLDLDLLKNTKLENTTKQTSNTTFLNDQLKELYQTNSSYFLAWEKNTRRLTKHSLEKNWQISIAKTSTNFEGFYKLLFQTSKRQNFSIQPKEYLRELFDRDFSRIIVLKDSVNEIQAAWFGIITEDTLTNLYAGNSQVSLKDNGQYLMHLVAIKIALDEKLRFYDMGGYNPKLSFGKFKDGYKGNFRFFLGPIDIILANNNFKIANLLIKLAKFVLGKKNYEY